MLDRSKEGRPSASPRGRARKTVTEKSVQNDPSLEEWKALITRRAYELYAERGYRHGFALEDWLDAEREILSRQPAV